MTWLDIVLFILGFVLLIKGADWMVEGASALAKKLNVPDLVIGLTIVSFGTSAPEMVVNIIASLNGSADLAIGAVYPAAGFVRDARELGKRTLELNLEPSQGSFLFHESRLGPASELVPAWVGEMLGG